VRKIELKKLRQNRNKVLMGNKNLLADAEAEFSVLEEAEAVLMA
jgi:hypothetical protein